jgi:hypothetical protein
MKKKDKGIMKRMKINIEKIEGRKNMMKEERLRD